LANIIELHTIRSSVFNFNVTDSFESDEIKHLRASDVLIGRKNGEESSWKKNIVRNIDKIPLTQTTNEVVDTNTSTAHRHPPRWLPPEIKHGLRFLQEPLSFGAAFEVEQEEAHSSARLEQCI
jgi:hypothetical protein